MDALEFAKLAAWVAGSFAALFAATHAVARPEFSDALSRRLVEANLASWVRSWPPAFVGLFDAVFGARYLSLRFVLRSFAASLAALAVTFVAFLIFANLSFRDYLTTQPEGTLFIGLLKLAIANLIPDYISLVETRLLMGRLREGSSVSRICITLLLDIVFTTVIFIVIFPIFSHLNLVMHGRYPLTLDAFFLSYNEGVRDILKLLASPRVDPSISLYFEDPIQLATTYFTSVWLWLFALGVLLIKVVERFAHPVWKILRDNVLDLERKPLLALGWISSSLVLIMFCLVAPFAIT